MLYILKEMLKLFTTRREKLMLAGLVVISFICALLDLIGIGVLFPLVMVLLDSSSFEKIGLLKKFFGWLPEYSKPEILLYAAIIIPLIFIVKNGVIILSVAIQQKFAFWKYWDLQKKLFHLYLYAPYSFHLQRNSSRLMRNLQMIDTVVMGTITPAIFLFSEIMVVVLLSLFILWMNPMFFLFIALIMSGTMLLFYVLVKRRMHRIGLRKMTNKERAILHINQGLGSIKEAIISGKEDYFLREFSKYQKVIADTSFEEQIYNRGSSVFIETVLIVTVSLLIISALTLGFQVEVILASLSVFALVAVRLMPSVNRVTTQMSIIRYSAPCLHEVLADLKTGQQIVRHRTTQDDDETVTFDSKIKLNAVSFRYAENSKDVLDGVNLTIARNSTVGIAGISGAGKTTLVDIILGLLEPSSGSVTVDGVDIRKNITSWQRKLGYIPQHIYICDDSIKNNIAWGIDEQDIDHNRLREVIAIAQLDKFIGQLPQGIDTIVGEHGARVSGGERQRIGIARALYHRPEVLIMDEATASLDNLTEKAFMDAINALSGKLTIIIIAHRLTTIQNCNLVYFMQKDSIASGTFDELLQSNLEFGNMARVSDFRCQ